MTKRPAEDDEQISFPEADEVEWRGYFSEFREKVWPMMREQGFSFSESYLVWRMEKLITAVCQARDVMEEVRKHLVDSWEEGDEEEDK